MGVIGGEGLATWGEMVSPFVEGAAAGELWIQRCPACGEHGFPPARLCGVCGSGPLGWVMATGEGEVWSYCIFHKSYLEQFRDAAPYNVSVVRLDEGPRMITNVEEVELDDLIVGMRVRARPSAGADGIPLIRFAPT